MTETAGYRDIDGMPTWVVERGEGSQTILLLHGGLGRSDELLESLGPHLEKRYRLVAFDRRGHGRTADDGEAFHYQRLADETRAVIAALDLAPVKIVGYSDGGIIALLLAMQHPELLRRAVLIGANFHYTGFRGATSADAAAGFAPPDASAGVAARVMHMWRTEPTLTPAELASARTPLLVMAADRDAITPAHTVAMFEALPDAQLAIVPGATHNLPLEKPELVARLVAEFFG